MGKERTSLRGALRGFHPGAVELVGLLRLAFFPQLMSSASTTMLIARVGPWRAVVADSLDNGFFSRSVALVQGTTTALTGKRAKRWGPLDA